MAYEFNGSSQYISADVAVVSGTPCTFSANGRCTRLTLYNTAFSQGNSADAAKSAQLVWAGTDSGDPIATYVTDGTSVFARTTAAYTTNVWHSGVSVFAGTTSRSVFIDGANKATNTSSKAFPTVDRTVIGATIQSTARNYFSGRICECAIWDVDLTDAEVTSLARGFKPYRIRPQSLVFYAPLIRNIADSVGAVVLTNNNTATVADHPRVI